MRGWIRSILILIGLSFPGLAVVDPSPPHQPEQQLEPVLQLIAQKHLPEARQSCAAVIRQNPDYYRAYPVYLNLARAEDRLAEAVRFLETVCRAAPGSAAARYGLGIGYSRTGDIERARDCFSEAAGLPGAAAPVYVEWVFCAQRLKKLDELREQLESRTGDPLAALGAGMALALTGQYVRALESYQKSLDLAVQRKDLSLQAVCLNKISIARFYQGDFPPALQAATRSLELARRQNDVSVFPSYLSQLGIVNANMQNDGLALGYFNEALRLAESTADDQLRGMILLNKGNIHVNRSELRQARNCYSSGLIIMRRLKDRRSEGFALLQLGVLSSKLASYREALDYFSQSLTVAQDLKDAYLEAMSLLNIGGVYQDTNDSPQAETYYRRTLELPMAKAGKVFAGQCQSRLGNCLLSQAKYDQAGEAIEKAVHIFRETGQGYEQGTALLHRAILHLNRDQLAPAAERAHELLTLSRRNGYHLLTGSACLLLAEVHVRLKNFSQADEFARQARDIIEPAGHRRYLPTLYYRLGRIAESREQPGKALDYYRQAVCTSEDIRRELGYEGFKISYQANWIDLYRALARLLVKQGRNSAGGAFLREAFACAERAKARSLLDRLQLQQQDIRMSIPPALLKRRHELEEQLAEAEIRLQEMNSGKRSTAGEKSRLITQTGRWRRQHQQLLVQIALEHPASACPAGSGQPLAAGAVQQFLAPDEALLEYLAVEDGYLAFVLGRGFFSAKFLPADPREVENQIKALRQPFTDFREHRIDLLHLEWDCQLACKLYQTLMAPVADDLARFRPPGHEIMNLTVVPDGALFLLPFEALAAAPLAGIEKEPAGFTAYQSIPFLLHHYAISYSASASILDPRLRGQDRTATGGLLVLADPDPDRGSNTPAASADDRLRLAAGREALWPLPGTGQEAQGIAALMGQEKSRILLGPAASEASFKREAGRYRFLHLATHGLIDPGRPDQACLVLAPDGPAGEDGFLRMHEIYNLDLRAELVVLSACDTAAGDLLQGEGILGLSRAFLMAGARQVVASLWPVEDRTGELMGYFYEELAKGGKAKQALRQAKLRFLMSTGPGGAGVAVPLAHPFFWAPFVLNGR